MSEEIMSSEHHYSEFDDYSCDNCDTPFKDAHHPNDQRIVVLRIFQDEILEYFYCSEDCVVEDIGRDEV